MVLIGSHYDTVRTSPGVDDNGSGMTALLQVLKLITSPGFHRLADPSPHHLPKFLEAGP